MATNINKDMLASHLPAGRDGAKRVNEMANAAKGGSKEVFTSAELAQMSAEFEKVLQAHAADTTPNKAVLNDFLRGIEGDKTWLGTGGTKHPQLLRYFQNYLSPEELKAKYPEEVADDGSLRLQNARAKLYDSVKSK